MHPQLLIVSGLSCSGKTPLVKAIDKLAPGSIDDFPEPVLLYSRAPRPNEVDGRDDYSRGREEIEDVRAEPRFTVCEARSDLQAVHGFLGDGRDAVRLILMGQGIRSLRHRHNVSCGAASRLAT